jgi:glucose-6-phosphate-specific signal transduction histidine kinase
MLQSTLTRIPLPVLRCCLAILIASFLINLLIQINAHLGREIPWFIVPATLVAVATFEWSKKFADQSPRTRVALAGKATAAALAAAALLVIAGLLLMGPVSWREGHLQLPGDLGAAPFLFRIAHSLVYLAYPGIVEEAAIRNVVQFQLQREMPPFWAKQLPGLSSCYCMYRGGVLRVSSHSSY